MQKIKVKDYLIKNYTDFIEDNSSLSSFTEIARRIKENDDLLKDSSLDGMRKSVRNVLRDLEKKKNEGVVKYTYNSQGSNVLIIGDLHEPFCLDGYLEFCLEQRDKWNCDKIVFIGDIIDNHYSSYHETDADGMGGGDELELAKKRIAKWYQAFPEATVTLGNHDIMISRKAQSGQIPRAWIKEYKEVLETPGWDFVEEIIIDEVLYHHGIGSKAHVKAKNNMISTVGGHWHTQAYTQWLVGKTRKIFGMQIGCGISIDNYAMAYGKWFPKPAIACGVILKGKTPINLMMEL